MHSLFRLVLTAYSLTVGIAWAVDAPSPPPNDKDASAAFLAGNYEAAIVGYNKILERDPHDALSHNGRGLAYQQTKDYAWALADFNEAIRINPLGMFYFNRGYTYYASGNDKLAMADFSKVLKSSFAANKSVRAHCLIARARCYINQSQSGPAMSDVNAAIKLGTKDPDAYILRGVLHKVAHAYDKSVADYEEAIALDPKNADAYSAEAYLLSVCPAPKYRDGKKAIRYATKSCDLSAWHNASAVEALAAAYAETGKFEEAIKFQKMAGEIDPQKADSQNVALYAGKHPLRDLNRSEKMGYPLAEGGVSIRLGENFRTRFEIEGGNLIHPQRVSGGDDKTNSVTLDFYLVKGQHVLLLDHTFVEPIRMKCLARLKDQDAFFETDLLRVPRHTINREIWSDPIEELVLFDFHFAGDDPQRSITAR